MFVYATAKLYVKYINRCKNCMLFFMSIHSGQTKCPLMWTFVLSAIKVILIKMYYLIY